MVRNSGLALEACIIALITKNVVHKGIPFIVLIIKE
jgi:hypothetical protein